MSYKMNVTIKDVAKAAGVSVATVSRVLNKKDNVSDVAIEAVNAAIDNLGYSPNYLGRDLRKCETRRILAIIPSTEHSFYSDVLFGMQETALSHGYDVLIGTTNDCTENESRLLGMLFNRSVDAAVLLGPKLDAKTLNKLGKQYNLALCCERLEGCNTLTVTIDNVKAGYDAVETLINKGHSKIAMISTSIRSQSSIDREVGYRKALEEHGIPFNEDYLYKGTYDLDQGEKAAVHFLGLDEPPTAIFAISDTLAVGAIRKAIELGYEVGEKLQIIGFDDSFFSRVYSPSISTVRQPCYEQGKKVIELLINNIKKDIKGDQIVMLDHSMILRQSTGD